MGGGWRPVEIVFSVLGPLRVDGGPPVPLTAALPCRLLALLLLNCDRVVTIDRIREELWSDRPPRSSAANLSGYLTRVRRAAGSHVENHPAGHRITLARWQLDLHRFRDGIASARRASAARDLGQAAGEFRRANGLWSGSALEGMAAGPVLGPLVHALDEERWAAVEDEFDVALLLGRHRSALPAIVANAVGHPSRERAWAQLMVALFRSGRACDALAAYARMQRRLADEFGVAPTPALQRLRHRIWSGDPLLARGDWRSQPPQDRADDGRRGVVARTPRVAADRRVVADHEQAAGWHQPVGDRHSGRNRVAGSGRDAFDHQFPRTQLP
jgi:DNA-binding SARP family transcriptional activator